MADPAAPEIGHASVEQDGRVLTGGGTTTAELEAVMERHAPPEPEAVPESAPAPAAPATADPSSPPKPTRGQARFAELTQKAKDAEAKAAAAEQKARDLEARLTQPPSAAPQTNPASPAPQPRSEPVAPQYTRPEPSEDEIGSKYATYSAFTKDQALWVWEQQQSQLDQRIRQSIEGDRAYRSYQDQVEATRAKGRAAYADFDAMLNSGPGGQVQMPLDRIQAIYALPNSEHVQYQVMKDAQLAQRLAQLPPIAFGLELAKLTGTNGTGTAPVAPAVAQAPAPYQPVGSGSRTTVPSAAEIAEKGSMDFDKSGYREARAKERGTKFRKFGR